MIIDTHLHLFI